jgi:suppressor of ftsI
LPLPRTYGVDDIPLVIQDKRLKDDGSLDFGGGSALGGISGDVGRLGGTILVNGTYDPHLAISKERVRFRLLNGSGARIYNVGFTDERAFDLIATDAGLLEQPHRLRRVTRSRSTAARSCVSTHTTWRGFAGR